MNNTIMNTNQKRMNKIINVLTRNLTLVTFVIQLTVFLASIASTAAYAAGEKTYRTGLEAKRGHVSVSPDGRYLIFDTDRLAHGLRLLNLSNGTIGIIPPEAGRTFGFPSWSPDGRQVAVVSAVVRDNRYIVENMQIAVLDTTTWQHRVIVASEGVKFSPFFSADGKTVYYFNGKKRESGKTVASRYDLFAIDLASGRERRLTNEEFYQAEKGDENSKSVLFMAVGGKRYKEIKDAFGKWGGNTLYLYDRQNGNAVPISMDQSSGIFNFSEPQRDKAGNLYFIAAKKRPGGGNFLWFLFKSTGDGKNPLILSELPISFGFDIAKNTGEIYVMDKIGEEMIIRKLATTAVH